MFLQGFESEHQDTEKSDWLGHTIFVKQWLSLPKKVPFILCDALCRIIWIQGKIWKNAHKAHFIFLIQAILGNGDGQCEDEGGEEEGVRNTQPMISFSCLHVYPSIRMLTNRNSSGFEVKKESPNFYLPVTVRKLWMRKESPLGLKGEMRFWTAKMAARRKDGKKNFLAEEILSPKEGIWEGKVFYSFYTFLKAYEVGRILRWNLRFPPPSVHTLYTPLLECGWDLWRGWDGTPMIRLCYMVKVKGFCRW